jgi:hypothetical protein
LIEEEGEWRRSTDRSADTMFHSAYFLFDLYLFLLFFP